MNQLEAIGGFAPAAPQPATIEWDGKDAQIFVRVVSYAEMQRLLVGDMPKNITNRDQYMVSQTLRLGNGGADALSYEQVGEIIPTLFKAIIDEVFVLNGIRDRKTKVEPEAEPEK